MYIIIYIYNCKKGKKNKEIIMPSIILSIRLHHFYMLYMYRRTIDMDWYSMEFL